MPLAMHYATFGMLYVPGNELEGKGADESLVLCMEEMSSMVGSGSCIEEGQGDCSDDDIEAKLNGSTLCI